MLTLFLYIVGVLNTIVGFVSGVVNGQWAKGAYFVAFAVLCYLLAEGNKETL